MASLSRSSRILVFIAFSVAAILFSWTGSTAGAQRPLEPQSLSNLQPQLLERTLAELKATPAHHPQIYFVGFAGYGRQAVFKREVLAVRQLFDDRFGTKGRSVALINHRSTVKEIPLADIANLDRVL